MEWKLTSEDDYMKRLFNKNIFSHGIKHSVRIKLTLNDHHTKHCTQFSIYISSTIVNPTVV